ncbi:MAG: AMP-binding protein [Treponema sp.]|nr:AMP-binding protein [Treponema sp.]
MSSINFKQTDPIVFLDEFRQKDFTGEWPTLPEMFNITVKRFPNNNCFTDFEGPYGAKQTITYSQAKEKILALANWMAVNGVQHGDHVAVSGKNSPEWTVVYLSALYAGAIIIPIDYALHTTEVDNLLNTAKPKLFFVDSEKYEYYAGGSFDFKTYSLSPKYSDTYAYNLKSDETAQITLPTENEIAAILFTSGTTGIPKGVMLSHKNIVSDCYLAQTNMNIYSTDVFYALLPLHHAYTMVAVFIEAISVGAEVVFGKSMAVSRLMKELKEGKITMLLGVPLLFNKLLAGIMKGIKSKGPVVYGIIKFMLGLSFIIKKLFNCNPGKVLFKSVLKQANIYTLRIAICGGGPLAPSIFKIYNELGIDFVQGYGLTETSPIIALNPVYAFKIQSVGKNLRDVEFKVLNPDEDGVGELCVKGPMVMQGYYQMPEETKATFTEDGWFKTGDLGWIDSDGYVMLSGRAKNMIVTEGGKNVYPEEIENAFQLDDELEQITIQGYIMDEATKSEGIEALVYPADSLLSRINVKREDKSEANKTAILNEVNAYIDRVNRTLQPYQRISKVTILDKPLEMTTTKKVKRNYSK